jgi:hypothetical protein
MSRMLCASRILEIACSPISCIYLLIEQRCFFSMFCFIAQACGSVASRVLKLEGPNERGHERRSAMAPPGATHSPSQLLGVRSDDEHFQILPCPAWALLDCRTLIDPPSALLHIFLHRNVQQDDASPRSSYCCSADARVYHERLALWRPAERWSGHRDQAMSSSPGASEIFPVKPAGAEAPTQAAESNRSAYEDLSSRCVSLLLAVATSLRTSDSHNRPILTKHMENLVR